MNPFQELSILYRFCRNKLGLGRLKSIRASLRGDLSIFTQGSGSTAGQIPMAVPNTSTYYSTHRKIKYASSMGIFILMGSPSTGACNLKIQMQQSYTEPATEGSIDGNWVIGDGVPDIYTNLNDGTTPVAHIKTLSLVPMKLCRLLVTGLGSNASDVTLLAILFSQELIA
jgi:hypothetical protein